MSARIRYRWFSLLTMWVVLFSLVLPLAALAEGETPPTEEAPATEPAGETPPTEETITETPPADAVTAAEVLEAAPEGTELVVLDENGEALPLATTEAAAILAYPDPQFCPGSLPAGDAGCSPVRTTINDALNDAYAYAFSSGENGTIYIEAGTFEENVLVNAANFTAGSSIVPSLFTLSGAGSGSTFLDGTLYINNMNSVTVSGLTIEDVGGVPGNSTWLTVDSASGDIYLNDLEVTNPNGIGIDMSFGNAGDVTLINVDSNNNGLDGVIINNTAGSGFVFVDSSHFNLNGTTGGGSGLYISSNGSITITDSFADGNAGFGANLFNDYGGVTEGINLTSSQFNGNDLYDGVSASSNGSFILTNVNAEFNSGNGVYLYNAYAGQTGVISVTGSDFDSNGQGGSYGDGINASSNSDITLSSVTAEFNYGNGAYMYNAYSGATGAILVSSGGFDSNGQGGSYGDGMNANSNRDITLTSVTAEFNFGNGIYLYNGYSGETGAILVSSSEFDSNGQGGSYGDGINASSNRNITLSTVTAEFNYGNGAYLYNANSGETGAILVSSGEFDSNGQGGSYGDGINAASNGDISLFDVSAGFNYGYGAYLYNSYVGATGNVFVDPSTFNSNGQGGGFGNGLTIYTNGNILIADVTANDNNEQGAFLSSDGDATVCNSTFNNNNAYGIAAPGVGGIFTLSDVTFSGNTLGDYNGSPVITSGVNCFPSSGGGGGGGGKKPVVVLTGIPVTGGPGFPIDCTNPELFIALLENNNRAIFNLLCGYEGMLVESQVEQLPGELPEGAEFHGGMNITVLDEGSVVQPLPKGASVTPSFVVEKEDAEYAILHWNGSEWVEVEGKLEEEDGTFYFQAEVEFTGTFVLVMK